MTGNRPRVEDIAWGVRWGLSFAVVYSLAASVIFGLGGGASSSTPLRMLLLAVIGAYAVAGLLAGVVVGLLRRRLHTVPGALIASVAAGVPAWAAMGTVASGQLPYDWNWSMVASYTVCVLVASPLMGLSLRRRMQ